MKFGDPPNEQGNSTCTEFPAVRKEKQTIGKNHFDFSNPHDYV